MADLTWRASPEYVRAVNRTVGRAIREARDTRDLTQGEVAARVDVSRGSIANIERGSQTVAVPLLLRISEALRVPVEQLLQEPSADSLTWLQAPESQSPLLAVQALDDDDRAKQVQYISEMLGKGTKQAS